MKSKLSKNLRKEFNNRLEKEISKFKPVKPKQIHILGEMVNEVPPGDRLYLWEYNNDLYFYISLVVSTPKMGDAFTIECAYSTKGRFPSTLPLLHPVDIPKYGISKSIPKNGEFRFRLGELFQAEDFWWWIIPNPSFEEINEWVKKPVTEETLFMPQKISDQEAMNNIEPLVKDVIEKIKNYAIPYFEQVIQDYEATPNYWLQFEKYDVEKEKKRRLLIEYGGEIDQKCCMMSCNNKRLRKVAYCLEHIYEEMKDKMQI